MKIALINAPRPIFENESFSLPSPPLAIWHLNGFLYNRKIISEVIDLNTILMENRRLFSSFDKINVKLTIEEFILENKGLVEEVVDYFMSRVDFEPFDILGISILEGQSLKIALPLIRRIKDIYPNKKIIVGGNCSNLISNEETIDFIVNGRGESALLSIIEGIQNKTDLPRHSHKEYDFTNQVVLFDGDRIDNYRFVQEDCNVLNDLFSTPLIPYKLSDGCLYHCSFCSKHDSEFSFKEPAQVVEELKEIKARSQYKYFYFLQEHLTVSKSYVNELCDRIIDSKLDILWSDAIKPLRYLSQNIYYKMRESGCIRLGYGIETGSPRIMKLMNKGHTISDCENNLKFAHKAGILTEANTIVGFPTEGEKEFNETLDFLRRNKNHLDFLGGNIFRILQRSPIMENPEKYGVRIKTKKRRTQFVGSGVYKYDEIGGFTYEKLQEIYESRQKSLFKFWFSLKNDNIENFSSRGIVFPLYDMLGSKDQVLSFLKDNADLIQRSQRQCHSLFTGATSNQKIQGNLHLCRINRFNLIPLDTIMKRIQEIFDNGFTKLVIIGGEPLIHKDIFKILSASKEIGFDHIVVKTNARILKYQDFCKRISEYVDEILVISPSDDEEEYESISGVKGSYLQSKKGIENWKKLDKNVRYYVKKK